MSAEEEWREIAEAPDYDISNLGRVRSRREYNGSTAPRILALRIPTKDGCPTARLQAASGRLERRVHTFVLDAFVGPLPSRAYFIQHLNGDLSDNRLENLRYEVREAEGCFARVDPLLRFWPKVARGEGCWPWLAGLNSQGYGEFFDGERQVAAHRFAYEAVAGRIPEGLDLDHLCRNRACVNPAHLEPVTHRTNVLRGESPAAQAARLTHCLRGHPLSGEGIRVSSAGKRVCRECERSRGRAARERRAAARSAS